MRRCGGQKFRNGIAGTDAAAGEVYCDLRSQVGSCGFPAVVRLEGASESTAVMATPARSTRREPRCGMRPAPSALMCGKRGTERIARGDYLRIRNPKRAAGWRTDPCAYRALDSVELRNAAAGAEAMAGAAVHAVAGARPI